VALAALGRLARDGKVERDLPRRAMEDLGLDPEKVDPTTV
jgi:pyruvate dehydrogenase complex dehydrogenase (E1) component